MGLNLKLSKIKNWSRTAYSNSFYLCPKNTKEIKNILIYAKKIKRKITIEGNGLNYNDQTLNDNGIILSTKNLDKITKLQLNKKMIEVEAGCTISKVLDEIIPHNYSLNSVPGSKNITAGGALINNVHGKDSSNNGGFVNNLIEATILDGNGKIRKLKKTQFPRIMSFGLFFIILKIKLRISKIKSSVLCTKKIPFKDFDEMVLLVNKSKYNFFYGWINCFSKNANGFLEVGNFNNENKIQIKNINFINYLFNFIKKINFPIKLNYFNIRIFNYFFFRKKINKSMNLIDFLYPISDLNFNEFFKEGLMEIQILISEKEVNSTFKTIWVLMKKYNIISYNMGIKHHKSENFLFSFYKGGYSLSIVFDGKSYKNKNFLMFRNEIINLIYKKKIFLNMSKEFFLKECDIKKLFVKELIVFKKYKNKFDPKNIFKSNLSRRLNLI